jgi:hypothetical protein
VHRREGKGRQGGGDGKGRARAGQGQGKGRARAGQGQGRAQGEGKASASKARARAMTDLIADATKHLCKSWGFLSAILRTSPLTAPPPQGTHRAEVGVSNTRRSEGRRAALRGGGVSEYTGKAQRQAGKCGRVMGTATVWQAKAGAHFYRGGRPWRAGCRSLLPRTCSSPARPAHIGESMRGAAPRVRAAPHWAAQGAQRREGSGGWWQGKGTRRKRQKDNSQGLYKRGWVL